MYTLIRVLSKRQSQEEDETLLRGVGSVVSSLISAVPSLQDQLESWLVGVNAECVGQSHLVHRAVVLAMSIKMGTLALAFRTMEIFTKTRAIEKRSLESS